MLRTHTIHYQKKKKTQKRSILNYQNLKKLNKKKQTKNNGELVNFKQNYTEKNLDLSWKLKQGPKFSGNPVGF